jgi:hypothetical protein
MATPKQLIKRSGSHKTATATVTPEGLKVLTAMAAEGQDQRTMAKRFGLSQKTLQSIAKRDPEVEEALAVGKAALADELTHLLLANARKGNVIAAIYLTKARLGWREGDTPDARPNIVINLPDAATPEAYMRLINTAPLPSAHAPLLELKPHVPPEPPKPERPIIVYADD